MKRKRTFWERVDVIVFLLVFLFLLLEMLGIIPQMFWPPYSFLFFLVYCAARFEMIFYKLRIGDSQ